MSDVNFDWAREQLEQSNIKGTVRMSVLALLAAWDTVERDPAEVKEIVEIFSALSQGHALVSTPEDEIWVQAAPGDIVLADTVRVRHDAFSGEVGTVHNGRVGKVVGIRYGDIIVRSTDGKEPFLDGVHYPATALDRRIK